MEPESKPIVVILGPTASGKTELAIKLALEFNGEIICADSRTIYTGLDIGTAKPTAEERKTVVHHGLDLVEPDQRYSAADFQKYATGLVRDIQSRGKLPILVGGSGLYIDGFVYQFEFASQPAADMRKRLLQKNLLQLQQHATSLGISEDMIDFQNPRHLARLIERFEAGQAKPSRKAKPNNLRLIGLQIPREELFDRIEKRVDTMFNGELINEVKVSLEKYGPEAPGLLASGYRSIEEYIFGNLSFEESKSAFIRSHKYLAKRQQTWFKRNPDIIWCNTADEAEKNIRAFLQDFDTIDT